MNIQEAFSRAHAKAREKNQVYYGIFTEEARCPDVKSLAQFGLSSRKASIVIKTLETIKRLIAAGDLFRREDLRTILFISRLEANDHRSRLVILEEDPFEGRVAVIQTDEAVIARARRQRRSWRLKRRSGKVIADALLLESTTSPSSVGEDARGGCTCVTTGAGGFTVWWRISRRRVCRYRFWT